MLDLGIPRIFYLSDLSISVVGEPKFEFVFLFFVEFDEAKSFELNCRVFLQL